VIVDLEKIEAGLEEMKERAKEIVINEISKMQEELGVYFKVFINNSAAGNGSPAPEKRSSAQRKYGSAKPSAEIGREGAVTIHYLSVV